MTPRYPRLFVPGADDLTPEQIADAKNWKMPPPMTPEEHQKMSEESWARAREYGPAFKGPFLGPWIEHSHHRFSRSWHSSLGGGGPAAVVQGSGMRFKWFAFNNLLGSASGEVCLPYPYEEGRTSASVEAMAAADAFLAQDTSGPNWVNYPLIAHLRIVASPWFPSLDFKNQWFRTWKDTVWPAEKNVAARITRLEENHFQWTCWSIYSEEHIGLGRETTLEKAQEMADATLRAYCLATEGP